MVDRIKTEEKKRYDMCAKVATERTVGREAQERSSSRVRLWHVGNAVVSAV